MTKTVTIRLTQTVTRLPPDGDTTNGILLFNYAAEYNNYANNSKWKFFCFIAKKKCGPFWVALLFQEIPRNDNNLNSMDHCLPQSTTLPGFYK